ncbi:hypothetical protein Zmor_001891 [Zophobas morio]|uniref:Uncharacterized protein n=1 Tax=Zophobas morio TaxID=2755281 RepID=A0AA38JA55_9CUCU|nr:hypothetical protein Zmor_001891 [Zophobas morio]
MWQIYHQKIEDETKAKEAKQAERKKLREEKKRDKNISTFTDVQGSETYQKNYYVIVKYEENHYPGQVLNITEKQIRVNAMIKSGLNSWKWSNDPDVVWYEKEDVVTKNNEPKKN